ncbi:MAG: hypothetical protein MUF13_03720 [Akkermansiaceae bacterium]|jgi:hypothetical protein|nr:hypothetical protein [Akkermansiaceae bacterium]
MNTTFEIVSSLLKWIADLSGFTYNEVNIIAYYIILPFAYVILADRIFQKHMLKSLYVVGVSVGLFLITDFTEFSDWLFQRSVDFLLSFQFLGWNYIVSSVLICVVFPAVVFVGMFHFAFPKVFPAIGRRLSRERAPTLEQNS